MATLTLRESQSLSIRAMSFDMFKRLKSAVSKSLNPFRAGRCLSTLTQLQLSFQSVCLNPFRAGRCLSTVKRAENLDVDLPVSIPFEQGDVFRLKLWAHIINGSYVSIPFEQGDVFRPNVLKKRRNMSRESQSLSSRAMSFDLLSLLGDLLCLSSLNPFRAGRCLSTLRARRKYKKLLKLNPFRAGRCLSTLQWYAGGRNHAAFQTHFPIFGEG